nr:hypothetical protein [Candidatus Sigynarchaeota archaeon]
MRIWSRRKTIGLILVSAAAIAGIIIGISMPRRLAIPTNIREILGVTHVAGKYNIGNTTGDYLNQGADTILDLGSRTIKLWFHDPKSDYPFNSAWPESFSSLVEMAQHPYFQAVFHKPFITYILMVYSLGRSDHYWTAGISQAEEDDEQLQFYELTKYFLTNFTGTNKTFIFQHWEGDWAIRGSYNASQDPTQTAIDGMVAWLNARQAGVDQARNEAGENGIHVYHAAEVNLVAQAMDEGKPCVVNRVLPNTTIDLVSYSSWDTEWRGADFRRALDFIAQNMPDNSAFGDKNVYVGEFGWPENGNPLFRVQGTITNVVETGISWGAPYIVYWQVFCNEPVREPVTGNDDCRGFWLVRPDGSKAWAWDYFQDLFDEVQASTSA